MVNLPKIHETISSKSMESKKKNKAKFLWDLKFSRKPMRDKSLIHIIKLIIMKLSKNLWTNKKIINKKRVV